jgi:hypothetical protein
MSPVMPQCEAGPRIEPPVSLPRAAGGSAGKVREIPWIARGRPRQIERRPAVRELVRLEFAEQDRAGVEQLLRGGGVFCRDVVAAHLRAAGGEYARRVVNILQRKRHAV